jgi:UDP-N-acetylglucosamine 1-carboxyvinyltransferase
VVELCEFLTKMGAPVTGTGSSKVRIEGGAKLRGAEHRLGGDYIEAGSWAVVGAITGGELAIEGARPEDIEVVAAVLRRMFVECGMRDGVFEVKPSTPRAVRKIATGLWPSFPSDLVSLVTVLATQAIGRTLVHDWMYELRLFALEQMSGMGADLFLADAHRIIVTGPTKLRGGRTLDSRDLRSGMSLIAAGLAAEGQTRVAPLETVERGYSQLVERLKALGAKVAKVE